MDMFRALDISASGLAAQRARMDVVAENLANSESGRTASGGAYRRKLVLLRPDDAFARALGQVQAARGVRVAAVRESDEALRRVWQPDHPFAGPDGMVEMPNVNPVQEMVDMLASTRAYEANATAFQATKSLGLKLLELLR